MLPNFVVIGGLKCGTTSLHYYLSLHPEIFTSRELVAAGVLGDKVRLIPTHASVPVARR
jgi:hypothetical protein